MEFFFFLIASKIILMTDETCFRRKRVNHGKPLLWFLFKKLVIVQYLIKNNNVLLLSMQCSMWFDFLMWVEHFAVAAYEGLIGLNLEAGQVCNNDHVCYDKYMG